MLSLRHRAALAARQASRVLQKKRTAQKREEVRELWKKQHDFIKYRHQLRAQSRAEAKEDILLGPNAPKRAATESEMKTYGAVTAEVLDFEPMRRKVSAEEWAIAVKDRVVVLKGPDRHKIGVVRAIDRETGSITVEGMNLIPTKVPEFFIKVNPDQNPIFYREMPLHYDDVRLVHVMIDPQTNKAEDMVVANVEVRNIRYNRRLGKVSKQRFIAGTDIMIPWPSVEKPEPKDEVYDTRLMDVEEETYTPTLLQPPVPEGLIDELRNKYSKYRVRHDPEFIERKEKEYAEKDAKLRARGYTIDERGKLVKLKRDTGFKVETPVLEDSVLEEIGRFMAQKKPEVLEEIIKMRTAQSAEAEASSSTGREATA